MKYFIAIPLPDVLQNEIETFQRQFPTNDVPNVIELHITVKRPQENVDIDFWIKVVKEVCSETKSFEITLDGVNDFEGGVVYLEPEQNLNLFNFHKSIYEKLEGTTETKGFEYDNYHPHVTLGGTSWGMTKKELLDMKEKAKQKFTEKIIYSVNFVRIYKKPEGAKSWEKVVDITLSK